MPLSSQIVAQLAAQLAPAIDFLLTPPTVAGLPPLPMRGDVEGVRLWLVALADPDALRVLEALPRQELVATALRELTAPPLPPPLTPAGRSPHITNRAKPVVDRHDLWGEVIALHHSTRRILQVTGDSLSGKSYVQWLIQEYCDQQEHGFVHVNLEGILNVERVVNIALNDQLGAAHKIKVEAKHELDTADVAWARSLARAAFRALRDEFRGKPVWLVIDHFERMPLADNGEAAAFFNTLIDLVATQPTTGLDAQNGMRLVLIDIREVPGDARARTLKRSIQRVSREDIERFVRTCRPALDEGAVQAHVTTIVSALREPSYMLDLGEQISIFLETP